MHATYSWLTLALLLAGARAEEVKPAPENVRQAVTKSLPFIEAKGEAWIREQRCTTCHHTTFLLWTHDEARRRGLPVDEQKLGTWTDWALLNVIARTDLGGGDTCSQLILGRDTFKKGSSRWRAMDPYENVLEMLLKAQSPDGHWIAGGQSPNPPEIATCWAILALTARQERMAPDSKGKDPHTDWNGPSLERIKKNDEALAKSRQLALAYLEKFGPFKPDARTEGLAARMLVEHQCSPAGTKDYFNKLLARQNADGGWPAYPTKPTNPSDAFATGQSLWALSLAGLGPADPVIQRGVHYLLSTQRADGSWDGKGTAVSLHPEGNPPDRVASLGDIYTFWDTAWATLGLLQTLPEKSPLAKN